MHIYQPEYKEGALLLIYSMADKRFCKLSELSSLHSKSLASWLGVLGLNKLWLGDVWFEYTVWRQIFEAHNFHSWHRASKIKLCEILEYIPY